MYSEIKTDHMFLCFYNNNNNNNNNKSRTDIIRQANRQGILIKHKQNKACQLIDMSVSSDSNISAKEYEKFSKI